MHYYEKSNLYGLTENAGHEIAGHEIDGPNCMA